MKIEIDSKEVLSEEEIRNIAVEAIRSRIRETLGTEQNAQIILSNLSYQIVFDEIAKIVPIWKEELVRKVHEQICEKDLSFHVWRKKGILDKEDSIAVSILNKAINDNAELIKSKVKEAIYTHDYTDEVINKLELLFDDAVSGWYELFEFMKKRK